MLHDQGVNKALKTDRLCPQCLGPVEASEHILFTKADIVYRCEKCQILSSDSLKGQWLSRDEFCKRFGLTEGLK